MCYVNDVDDDGRPRTWTVGWLVGLAMQQEIYNVKYNFKTASFMQIYRHYTLSTCIFPAYFTNRCPIAVFLIMLYFIHEPCTVHDVRNAIQLHDTTRARVCVFTFLRRKPLLFSLILSFEGVHVIPVWMYINCESYRKASTCRFVSLCIDMNA